MRNESRVFVHVVPLSRFVVVGSTDSSYTRNGTDVRADELFKRIGQKKLPPKGMKNIIYCGVQMYESCPRLARETVAMPLVVSVPTALTQYLPFVSKYNGIQYCI
jgi:hypothetical protein